jgi:hypothetical protein
MPNTTDNLMDEDEVKGNSAFPIKGEGFAISKSQAESVLKEAHNKYKTMANALVGAYKIKNAKNKETGEGYHISSGQTAILVLLIIFTSITILPWLVAYWIMRLSNESKSNLVEILVNIEIPSTIKNYREATDEKVKKSLRRLFKHQFDKAKRFLYKLSRIGKYKTLANTIENSANYKEAQNFELDMKNN